MDELRSAAPPSPTPGRRGQRRLPRAEFSPSGRARCVHCQETITWGEVRLAVSVEEPEAPSGRVTRFLHTDCAAEFEDRGADLGGLDWPARVLANSDMSAEDRGSIWETLFEPSESPTEMEIDNESTGLSIFAADVAARALRAGARSSHEPAPGDVSRWGGVLEQELIQDDSFTLRVRVDQALTEPERGWVGRSTTRLRIPCGRLMIWPSHFLLDELSDVLDGGWDPEDHYSPQRLLLPPGDYHADLYSYIGGVNDEACVGRAASEAWRAGHQGGEYVDFLLQLRILDPSRDGHPGWGASFPPGEGARVLGRSHGGLHRLAEPEGGQPEAADHEPQDPDAQLRERLASTSDVTELFEPESAPEAEALPCPMKLPLSSILNLTRVQAALGSHGVAAALDIIAPRSIIIGGAARHPAPLVACLDGLDAPPEIVVEELWDERLRVTLQSPEPGAVERNLRRVVEEAWRFLDGAGLELVIRAPGQSWQRLAGEVQGALLVVRGVWPTGDGAWSPRSPGA